MLPGSLTARDFAAYPPQARALTVAHLDLLRRLPMPLAPIVLRELITSDWKFPRERSALDAQLAFLSRLSPEALASVTGGFSSLRIDPKLIATDWVTNLAAFMESLTASLWSSGQMPAFRAAAEAYTHQLAATATPPPAVPARLGLVVIGQGVTSTSLPLFRRLRPEGVYLTGLHPEGGLETLIAAVHARASAPPPPGHTHTYAHWYIDGGESAPIPASPSSLTRVAYRALEPARLALLARTRDAIQSGAMGPERLRTLLAEIQPEDISLNPRSSDPILDHFTLTLLTEGSGTQIFATTFVQWAARECLRRAEPDTLLLRFAPRQRQQGMDELLTGARDTGPDPEGSLVDADMAAFYTWINMLRLPHAEQARFLVWFENHREALVIGPGLPRGTTSSSPLTMEQALALIA